MHSICDWFAYRGYWRLESDSQYFGFFLCTQRDERGEEKDSSGVVTSYLFQCLVLTCGIYKLYGKGNI